MQLIDAKSDVRVTAREAGDTIGKALENADRLPAKLLFTAVAIARGAGRHDDAEAMLATIRSRDGESIRLLEEEARLAFARGDHSTTISILADRYERSPSATAAIALAKFHLETGALDEAKRISDELVAEQGQLVTVKQLAADVARASGDFELARSHYLTLIDDKPEHPSSLLSLSRLSLDEGDAESAAAFFRRAVVADEMLTANQLAQASEIAAEIGEPELAAAYEEQARVMQNNRTEALLAEIDSAIADLPPREPPTRPAIERDRAEPRGAATTSTVRVRQPHREHEVALHTDQGSLEPDDPRVLRALRDEFGHERLRPGQSAVIANVLADQDTLAIMPTGIGKSLTFQLPAMLGERTTVVISPLIALMKDQVESLPEGVRERTALINSTLSGDEMRARLDQLARGELKLVYVAPERLRNYGFLRALRDAGVGRVVVDEAHCISMWGHDFRPDYLFIPRALTELDDPPILAITATATPDMVDQIARGLGRDLDVVRTSVFRPNLRYEVHHLQNKEAKLERVIQICRTERGAGIVYVSSRRDAESIAGLLRQRGVYAVPYHAGLDPNVRSGNQDQFMTGRARVVVATVAFGMGVNKADVRFILHLVPPRSLEAYAQESGRAGRDGRPARCVLLVSSNDRTQLVTAARRDEIDLATLRRVYGQLMRQARGPWAVIDPSSLRAPVEGNDNEPDPRIALGILEQAGLIRRHPDAPATYDLRRIGAAPGGVIESEFGPTWSWIEPKLPESWLARDACTIVTAELCAVAGLTPVDLDRVLQAHPGLAVREGIRHLCLYLEQISGDAARTLNELLSRASAAATERINQVMQYANDQRCRHAALAAHLGERLDDCGTSCDVCTGTAERATKSPARAAKAVTTAQDALAVLDAVRTLPFPMGKTGIVRLLLGSIESTVRADRSESFGVLSELPKGKVEGLVERLIDAGLLFRDESHEYRLISLTKRGAAAGLPDLGEFESPLSRSQNGAAQFEPGENRLYQRLAEWRRSKSAEEAVPAYVVASNSTLQNLSISRPATRTALLSVPGIGPRSVEKYGDEILAVIGESDPEESV